MTLGGSRSRIGWSVAGACLEVKLVRALHALVVRGGDATQMDDRAEHLGGEGMLARDSMRFGRLWGRVPSRAMQEQSQSSFWARIGAAIRTGCV